MSSIGIIILAAGSSSRLGQAKQQLVFKGNTLLERAVQAAENSVCRTKVVVVGANADAILKDLETTSALTVENSQWAEGMSSSIKVGLNELLKHEPDVNGAILMLCDQPFVNATLLNILVQAHKDTGKNIIASAYQNTLGAPVLFERSFFPELQLLQGQEGAKKLLSTYPEEIATVSFPDGAIDIDTFSDYKALLQLKDKH